MLSTYVFYKNKERIGFPNKYPEKRQGRSPFSDKASLTLRYLLNKRDKYFGIREIADRINVNAGFVSKIVKELELNDLVIKNKNGIYLYVKWHLRNKKLFI